jgi:hypothetical protein
MVFQGLEQGQAERVWHPFLDWVSSRPQDYHVVGRPRFRAMQGSFALAHRL